MNAYPRVLIEWEDRARPAPEWRFVSDIEAPMAVRCNSVGWLSHDGADVKALPPNMGNIDSDDAAQAYGITRISCEARHAARRPSVPSAVANQPSNA
jgi:hypothetical protein